MAHADSIPVWRRIGKTPVQRAEDTAAILVVGGGPVGLTVALDLGRRGHKVILLNRLDFIAAGSKAICFAKRTIEIFDRLGVGNVMMEKGVIWNVGKVYWSDGADPIYQFDLLRIKDQKRPAFINIQQYHVEERLVQALEQLPNVQIRWGHEAIELEQSAIGVRAEVRAGVEEYSVCADFLVACDGCRSTMRGRTRPPKAWFLVIRCASHRFTPGSSSDCRSCSARA